MGDSPLCRTVPIRNAHGLHARPAQLLANLAMRFQSHVELQVDGTCADGKSILEILSLGAAEGSQLQIQATGPDAQAALNALAELVEQNFHE